MKYVGADLHKKTITLCVLVVVRGKRQVLMRQRFDCSDTAAIAAWFKKLGKYRVVVEATEPQKEHAEQFDCGAPAAECGERSEQRLFAVCFGG